LDDDDPEQLDFVLGDYFITPERSQSFTFTPYFLATHMSTFRAPDGRFNSIEEANAGGGSVCVLKGTAMYDILDPVVNNIIACEPTFLVCVDDYLEKGVCDLVSDDVLYGLAAIHADEEETLVPTGENPVSDYAFYAFPLRSSLDPRIMQLMSRWIYQLVHNTDVMDHLSEKYFGITTGAMEYVQPDQFSLSAAVMRQKPFAYQNDDGEWEGYLIDMANLLQDVGKKDGVNFTISIDFEGGVLSDTLTHDGSLGLLEEGKYDLILGDYCHTSERSQRVTFAPSYLTSFVTTFRHRDGRYDSLEAMNFVGGVACIREGTAIHGAVAPLAANVLPCGPATEECFARLRTGDCDLYVEDRVFGRMVVATDPDVVANGDVLPPDTFFNYAVPMSSAVPPSAHVLMTKWTRSARTSGAFRDLEKKWMMPDAEGGFVDHHDEFQGHDHDIIVETGDAEEDVSSAAMAQLGLFGMSCLGTLAILL
jgi:ABC-type amino acid transport substrate-binding protein